MAVGLDRGADARGADLAGVPVVRLAPGSLPWRARALRRSRSEAARACSGGATAARRRRRRGELRTAAYCSTLDWYRRGIALVMRDAPGARPLQRLQHDVDRRRRQAAPARRVVYDSHELWPDRNLRPEPRWWLLLCEALFVRVADEVITTSPGYADVIARRYRIARPTVVRNVPERRARRRPHELATGAACRGLLRRAHAATAGSSRRSRALRGCPTAAAADRPGGLGLRARARGAGASGWASPTAWSSATGAARRGVDAICARRTSASR